PGVQDGRRVLRGKAGQEGVGDDEVEGTFLVRPGTAQLADEIRHRREDVTVVDEDFEAEPLRVPLTREQRRAALVEHMYLEVARVVAGVHDEGQRRVVRGAGDENPPAGRGADLGT